MAQDPENFLILTLQSGPVVIKLRPDVAHLRGVCSMARTPNPNSANSQFFICFDNATFLDGQYTVWGEVVAGMEHVDSLPKGEPPRQPGKIQSMRVAADVENAADVLP